MTTDTLILAGLLALVLGSLAWALCWLHGCLALLAELRSLQTDLRAITLGQHQSVTGSLKALHSEVKRGSRLTHLPGPPGEEEP